jgi:hypothetical protein
MPASSISSTRSCPRHWGSSVRQSSRARRASCSRRYTSIASGSSASTSATGACAGLSSRSIWRAGDDFGHGLDSYLWGIRRFNASTPTLRLPCRTSLRAEAASATSVSGGNRSSMNRCSQRNAARSDRAGRFYVERVELDERNFSATKTGLSAREKSRVVVQIVNRGWAEHLRRGGLTRTGSLGRRRRRGCRRSG